MNPKKMNDILKITLTALVVIAIGSLYFANKKLTKVAHDTAKLKADVQIADKQLKAYQQTKTTVDSLRYVDELATEVLPPNEDQSAIVAELSEFALRSKLAVGQITFPEVTKSSLSTAPTSGVANVAASVPSGVHIVPVTIQFQTGAQYTNVLSFLKTVESTRRKSQVTNITLTPDPINRANLSQVNISLNLYTQQPKGVK